MKTSYHVHTRWSDGSGEMGDYSRMAALHKLRDLGFSDHLVLDPSGASHTWSMPVEKLEEYVKSVLEEKERLQGSLNIRLGIEADFFPGTAGRLKSMLEAFPFDYVIGSVHIVDGFCVDAHPCTWEALSENERNEVIVLYWRRIRELAESGLCDIIAHMDLTKKFGYYATVDINGPVSEALDAMVSHGLAFELNTAGAYKPVGEFYPSPSLINECALRKIPVVITADAHDPSHITRSFDKAAGLLRESGYGSTALFEGRRRSSLSLTP
ncbi:MAG: histidinol-phosphatase HisJ family protein [Candidatus Eremiobacteraeota bacterium]|nr:histidinol-phosphatase HisJ family protein [Candidatus Eremiobacteraeota bacterium]